MMYSNIAAAPTGAAAVARTNRVLRNAYMLLGITLLPTIAGAFVGALFPIYNYLGMLSFVVFFGGMIGFQVIVARNRHSVAGIGWLLGFTAFMGYMIGPMLHYALGLSNGVQIIALAAGGTAAIFFIMAGYATVTKRNFASPSISKMLFIGLVMAVLLSAVNVFFIGMPAISLAVSSVIIPICAMFILHTVNKVVRGGETNYIMVTMTLYIMLLNLFQSLMHLLMAFGGSRE